MITLSNGYNFEYVASSGALGFKGKGYFWEKPLKYFGLFDTSLFTPITKTLTYYPRKGNFKWYKPWETVKLLSDGVLNSIGLTNEGFKKWLKENKDYYGIVSIYPKNFLEATYMTEILELHVKYLKAIEINISCPNTPDLCDFETFPINIMLENIKQKIKTPLILKISCANDINKLFPAVEKYIEAISINSVPWNIAYPNKKSLLEKYGGGAVSGKSAQICNWDLIKRLKEKTKIPIIGCSVWEYEDIQKLYDMKCEAIGFGSIFLKYPWRPTVFIRRRINNRYL